MIFLTFRHVDSIFNSYITKYNVSSKYPFLILLVISNFPIFLDERTSIYININININGRYYAVVYK